MEQKRIINMVHNDNSDSAKENTQPPPSAFYKAMALLILLSLVTFILEGATFVFDVAPWFDFLILFFVVSTLITGFSLVFFAKASDFEDCGIKEE